MTKVTIQRQFSSTIFSALFFAIALMAVPVLADAAAGKIVLIKGDVFILDAKANVVGDPLGKRGRKTVVGAEFFVGETLSTKPGARVKLQFVEGSNEVVLGADTTLLIERAGNGSDKKGTTLNLSKGEARSDVKVKYSGKGADVYEIKSKNAVAGVRGTIFTAIFNPATAKFTIATERGAVAVSAIGKGSAGAQLVTAGKFATASGDVVAPPAAISSNPELAQKVEALGGGGSDKGDSSGESGKSGGDQSDKSDKKEEKSAKSDDGKGGDSQGDSKGEAKNDGKKDGKGDGKAASNDGETGETKNDKSTSSNDKKSGEGGSDNRSASSGDGKGSPGSNGGQSTAKNDGSAGPPLGPEPKFGSAGDGGAGRSPSSTGGGTTPQPPPTFVGNTGGGAHFTPGAGFSPGGGSDAAGRAAAEAAARAAAAAAAASAAANDRLRDTGGVGSVRVIVR